MKLSDETVDLILRTTKLCAILEVEGIILDNKGIRGYNDDDGVVVASIDDHGFEFDKLGIARVDSLKYKFNLLKDLSKISVDAVAKKNNDDIIEKLRFEGGKINFEFRCAMPERITDIPSTRLNKSAIFSVEVTEDDVASMTQGSSAMRSKNMTLQGDSDDAKFRFSDETGDILNIELDSPLVCHTDKEKVSLTINLKKMLPIFKLAAQDGKFTLNILKNNIIYVVVDGLDVLVMPEVE